MTVNEAIRTADELKENSFSFSMKARWLEALENLWVRFLNELGYEQEEADINVDETEKELLIKKPYEEIYVLWLKMKINFYNGEIELYNNSAEAFNSYFEEVQKDFIRRNKPKKGIRFRNFREV